ncbi:MAG TPA: WXG100 family type VII secretion target, partial [Streptosporangiaceae bacterium]
IVSAISFAYEAVEDGRQSILTTCNDLADALNELIDVLTGIDTTWSGAASQAFQAAYARWQDAAAQVLSDLQFVHSMVCTAQTNFAAADTAALATWQAA